MRGKNLFFTGLVVALLGLVLILFRTSLADGGVVTAAGILFVAAGLLNTTVFLSSRDKQGRVRMGALGTAFGWIASAAAVVLGLAMLIFSKAFVAIVGFMFAVLLLFAALFQLFLLLFGSKPVRLSNLFFLVPTALIGAAIYIFMRKPDTGGEITVMLVTGISFIVFGVFTIVEGLAIGNNNRTALKTAKTDTVTESASTPASIPEAEKTVSEDAETPSSDER